MEFFKCMFCSKKYKTVRGLAFHVPYKHAKRAQDVNYKCPICKEPQDAIYSHIDERHKDYCRFCLKKGGGGWGLPHKKCVKIFNQELKRWKLVQAEELARRSSRKETVTVEIEAPACEETVE